MPAIEVNNLTKEYRLGALQSLKDSALNTGRKLLGLPVAERPLLKALDNISFTIEAGEVVGIIGHNGAGKSTLLKMLARISTPTSGTVKVTGRIAPLIEVGAGFVPDFTGRENVYLNGAILGMGRAEVDKKFDEIVDFAEMSKFIDTPVKRYSSGMQMKLAFSVATSIDAEILIVDEVLAVGDLAFQRKCFDRMSDLISNQGRTVLMVSHNIRQVERLCSRALLLEHGTVLLDADSEQVCDFFYERTDQSLAQDAQKNGSKSTVTDDIEFISICFVGDDGTPSDRIPSGRKAIVILTVYVPQRLQQPTFGIGIHTPDFLYLATQNSETSLNIDYLEKGTYRVKCEIRDLPFLPGVYSLRAGITEGPAARPIFYGENLFHFQIVAPADERIRTTSRDGIVRISVNWTVSCEQIERTNANVSKNAS